MKTGGSLTILIGIIFILFIIFLIMRSRHGNVKRRSDPRTRFRHPRNRE